MAYYTNLDYVQTIASSMDSEEVNAVDDSVESLQILKCVETVYNDIQARADLPEHFTLFELTASGDGSLPVVMYRPDVVNSIDWIQYNKVLDGDTDPVFTDIKFVPIDEFLKMQDSLLVSDVDVASMEIAIGDDGDTITFIFRTDQGPTYYTTFDDSTIIFDSYDSDVDTTLQKSKTRCYGRKDQSFQGTDDFVPFLDRDLSTLLLNEAKVLAFAELKQMPHQVAQQWAQRGWAKMQKSKRGIDQDRNELDRLPNYGRR